MCLVAFSGSCAVLGARFGSCEDGPPNFLYIAFAVLLLVVEAWQFWTAFPSGSDCRENCREKLWFVFFCGLGCFEVLDFFTDWQQIAQAYLCDSDFHDSCMVEELRSSSLTCGLGRPSPAHVGHTCGLPGPRSGRARDPPFFIATIDPRSLAVLSSFVGLGGLQRAVVQEHEAEGPKGLSTFFRAIGVDLPETLPGLLLQPSLFALTFADTDTAGQYKQLLSLAVSWAMALKAAVEVGRTLVKQVEKDGMDLLTIILFGLPIVFILGVFVTIGIGMLRVFYAYQCEDHVWNLFTGYVEL